MTVQRESPVFDNLVWLTFSCRILRLNSTHPKGGQEMRRILLILFFVAIIVASGQTLGTISGEVTDASGAVVPGAKVNIRNVATNAVRQVVTNTEGLYVAPSLQPGVYDVRVEKEGFRAAA